MPRFRAKNKITGETVEFDWEGSKPPTQADVNRISDQQRDSRIAAKESVAKLNEQTFVEKLLTSPAADFATKTLNVLGLNQPWHPVDSAVELAHGVRGLIEGGGPETTPEGVPYHRENAANPRVAAGVRAMKGAMGVAGPPLTALGYATGLGEASTVIRGVGAASGILNKTAALAKVPAAIVRGTAPMTTGFISGNVATEGVRRGIESMAPEMSPETKEAISTATGLLVGGLVGHTVNSRLRSNSTSSAPLKPTEIITRPRFYGSRQEPSTGVNWSEIIPPDALPKGGFPVPFQGPRQVPPGPEIPLLPERGLPIEMGPPPIQMPPAGTYAAEQALSPAGPPQIGGPSATAPRLTSGATQMPPAGTAEMQGQFRPLPPGLPEATPPLPESRQLAPGVPVDLTSQSRPEPLSPAEVPTTPVRSPSEQSAAPLPAPAQGPPLAQPVIPPTPLRPPVQQVSPTPGRGIPAPPPIIPPSAPTPTPAPVAQPEEPQSPTDIARAAIARSKPVQPEVLPAQPKPTAPPTQPTTVDTTRETPQPVRSPRRAQDAVQAIRDYLTKHREVTGTNLLQAFKDEFDQDTMREALRTLGQNGEIVRTGKNTVAIKKAQPAQALVANVEAPTQSTPLPAVKSPADIAKAVLAKAQPPKIEEPPKVEEEVEETPAISSPEAAKIQRTNQVLEFMKRRVNVTTPQLQTEFGLSGVEARAIIADLKRRGLVSGDKGKYNYNKMSKEEIPEPETPTESKAPLKKEVEPQTKLTPARAKRIEDIQKSIEEAGDDDTLRKFLEGQLDAQNKQAKLEAGFKTQKELAQQIDNLETQIDELETKNEDSPDLPKMYRELAKLEKRRDRELTPDAEKYGDRVAGLRSVAAEGRLAGLEHEQLSARAKAEFKVDSMSKLTPQQLAKFEEMLKTERLEKEAEIADLEEQDFEGTATDEMKTRLKQFWKDEGGTSSMMEGIRAVAKLLNTVKKDIAQSGETTLNKEGAGDLARDIRKMRTEGEIAAGKLIADHRINTKGLTDAQFKNMLGVLRGTERASSPEVAQAARAESARLSKVETRLGTRKINIDPINTARTDRAVLSDYYTTASRKIAEFENFGPRKNGIPEDIHQEIAKIKAAGKDHGIAYNIVDAYFNPDRLSGARQAVWDAVSNFEAATKLGLATIGNLTQPSNISLVVGNIKGAKATAKAYLGGESVEEFGLRSGATLSSVTHETQLTEGVTPNTLSSKILEWNGFSPVEVKNRLAASLAGAEHAVDMFKRLKKNPNDAYARRHLSHWLGLDPDILVNQDKLTMDQVYTAAHTLADRTQFRTTPLEIPPQWKLTYLNRIMTLFKSFTFNQGKFMKEAVLGELKRGNLRPLIPLFTMMPILGTLADRLKRGIAGREQPTEFWDTVIGAYTSAGGVGIVADIATRTLAGKLSDWVIGPAAGDVVESINALKSDTERKEGKGTSIGRFALKQIPVVGKPLAYRVFPQKKPGRVTPPSSSLPSLGGGSRLPPLP